LVLGRFSAQRGKGCRRVAADHLHLVSPPVTVFSNSPRGTEG
jgi:hypothetical protein